MHATSALSAWKKTLEFEVNDFRRILEGIIFRGRVWNDIVGTALRMRGPQNFSISNVLENTLVSAEGDKSLKSKGEASQ